LKNDLSAKTTVAMPKISPNQKTNKNGESKSFLQEMFGVDQWCTVYEEDEGFKLLADLSLCMYFGCGKKTDDDESEVPKVVSVTNSEDYDCSDTLSDICDGRHCENGEGVQAPEEPSAGSRKPDPPPTTSDSNVVFLIHPPPPPPLPIDTPSSERHMNVDESSRVSSRVAAHYESREALEDSDEENIPPPSTVVVGRKRRSKRRKSHENVPSFVYGKGITKTKHRQPADEYPADECDEYPVIVYSDDKSSVFGYV
jgi:hypothetical protein